VKGRVLLNSNQDPVRRTHQMWCLFWRMERALGWLIPKLPRHRPVLGSRPCVSYGGMPRPGSTAAQRIRATCATGQTFTMNIDDAATPGPLRSLVADAASCSTCANVSCDRHEVGEPGSHPRHVDQKDCSGCLAFTERRVSARNAAGTLHRAHHIWCLSGRMKRAMWFAHPARHEHEPGRPAVR
jgi:hypothetical protein